MKNILPFLLFTALSCLSLATKAQKVFEVKYVTDADVLLYRADSLHADLIAWQASTGDSATGNTGMWYFTSFANEAGKRVFFVAAPGDSIVSVYFTPLPQGTGWLNARKSFWLN